MGNFISNTMSRSQLILPLIAILFISFIITPDKCFAQLSIPQKEFTVCIGEVAKVEVTISKTLPVFIELRHQQSSINYTYTSETVSSFQINLITVGTYTILKYGTTGDTTVVVSDSIVISNYPPVSLALHGDGTFCSSSEGNILQINFSGTAPYTLEFYNNGVLDTITSETEIFSFDRSENHTLKTVRVFDAHCVLDTIVQLAHNVIEVQTPEISGKNIVCAGNQANYSTNLSTFSYNWSIPTEAVIISPTNIHSREINLRWATPGYSLVRLQLVDDASKCTSEWVDFNVIIAENPIAEINIDTTICFELNTSLDISIPTSANERVYWPHLNVTIPSASFSEGGNYSYWLINENACADTGFVTILDSCTSTLFVPEAFTPNGDPNNELLELFGLYYDLEFRVYSESGILLFTMYQDEDFWDGTVEGKDLPMGTYYWVAKYSDQKGNQYTKSGHVVLLR